MFRIYSKARSVMEEQGYNVLFLGLGFLEWYESESSDDKLRAPIVLVPVELTRSSVRTRFKMEYHEEEPLIINPALVVKMQNDFRISIEQISEELEDIDYQAIFSQIQMAIKPCNRWRVTNDIYLGLFSFAKFIMYKDIEILMPRLLEHPIIQMICGQSKEKDVAAGIYLEEKELDKILDPHKTFQILDADSSQQRAILAVQEGENLIIEGPPGTGKSQTIANIIAEFLAQGKKVLFVSQKMAALEVVKKRLDNNGLGDYCLELHSRKANKAEVMKELVRVLDMQQKPDHAHDDELARFEEIRDSLNSYVRDIHEPFGKLGFTPYQAFGFINRCSDIQDMGIGFREIKEWDKERYRNCCEMLDNLADRKLKIPDPAMHPWYSSRLTDVSHQVKSKLAEVLKDIIETHSVLQGFVRQLAADTFCKEAASINDIRVLIDIAKHLQEMPPVTRSLLSDTRWDSRARDVEDIIRLVKSYTEFSIETKSRYDIDGLLSDGIDLGAQINRYWYYSIFPPLLITSLFRRDRNTLKRYMRDKEYKPGLRQIIADLKMINAFSIVIQRIAANDSLAREYFGELWRGKDTDWKLLDGFASWMVKFRQYVIKNNLADSALEELSEHKTELDNSKSITATVSSLLAKLENSITLLIEFAKIDESLFINGKMDDVSLANMIAKIAAMKDKIDHLDDWARYLEALGECEIGGLKDFTDKALSINMPPNRFVDAFKSQFFKCWLELVFAERVSLKTFYGEDHDKLIHKFCEIDKKQIELAKIRIQHMLSGKFSSQNTGDYELSKRSELGIVQREGMKTRAHMPIRKLFERAPNAILDLKPCLMMSPLTVAQFINPESVKFDLVIFDEASQIPPEDGIGSILRGSQVVIAGDDKQLPPTSFFQSEVMTAEDEEDADEESLPDLDSILEECTCSGIRRAPLRWHYRSRHESLISFSNKHFYNNRLYTFPCAEEKSDHLGIKFHYLPKTTYDRGGSRTNIEEAREVGRAVFNHFKENPKLSIGVGTFSQAQKEAIEDVIEEMLKEDGSYESFFALDKPEHFFVKNLETIQGDERDVIYISVGYGKDASGKLAMNFGPVNKTGGARRLNVLVTRARNRLDIFSSIKGGDFDLSKTQSDGVKILKQYLDFAEKGKDALLQETDAGGFSESFFEDSVYELLVKKGLIVNRQVGCSGYRIDLAIVDDKSPGRYILGIECDGAPYHSGATARDRDRLRQQVLENLGWNIYRIWSTDWFKNPRIESEKLFDAIEKAKRGTFCKKKVNISPSGAVKYDYHSDVEITSQIENYSLTPITTVLPKNNIYNAKTSNIRSIFQRVIEHEGPIHRDEARRRVAQHWGILSVGSRIREILKRAEKSGIGNNMFREKDNFYWPIGKSQTKVRRRDYRVMTKNIEYINPEEINPVLEQNDTQVISQ